MAQCPSDDVLMMIGENIQDTKTKYSLVQCSKRFHQLFQPLLYSSLSLRLSQPSLDQFGRCSKCVGRKYALIQNLFRRPRLARLVHHLDISITDRTSTATEDPSPERFQFNIPLLEKASKAIWKFGNSKTQILASLKSGSPEAWSGLLLALLFHLRTLHLHLGYIIDPQFLSEALMVATVRRYGHREMPPFPHIHTVKITGEIDMRCCAFLFQIPSLRKVTCDGVSRDGSITWIPLKDLSFPGMEALQGASPITEISIHGKYELDMDDWIGEKLDTFKFSYFDRYGERYEHRYDDRIEAIYNERYNNDYEATYDERYEYRYDDLYEDEYERYQEILNEIRDDRSEDSNDEDNRRSWDPFRASRLRKSLLPSRNTLKTLWVIGPNSFENNDLEGDPLDPEWAVFGSLKEFSALRELRINFFNLIHEYRRSDVPDHHLRDLLPSSLEMLDIVKIDPHHWCYLIPNFKKLLEERDTYIPLLKTLRVGSLEESDETGHSFRTDPDEAIEILGDLCVGAGIKLVVHDGGCWQLSDLANCTCEKLGRGRN
ncbi:hypothetical protein Plec18167_004007 [Paecilomyces lecythidis]|uniref:Leucine-rich repeat domain-containing protein n=1 Tax=Paecilomyces lecythidis TaxID=3004212 RepID=A0ABR3XU84_9EURO